MPEHLFDKSSHFRLYQIGEAIFVKVDGKYIDRTTLLKLISGMEAASDIMLATTPEDYKELYETLSVDGIMAGGANLVWYDAPYKRNRFPCVYFLTGSKGIKIGRALNVNRRRSQIEWQLNEELKTLAFIETQHYIELERGLHTKFAHLQKWGEWFAPVDEILLWLDGLRGKE